MTKTNLTALTKNPLFVESRMYARQYKLISEAQGKQLGTDDIHTLFTAIQQGMTDAGQNKTLIGKGADALGKVGGMIAGLGRSLRDTTVVQGVDDTWADIKNKLSASLEKSPEGSTVLRSIDKYQQLVKKYPSTSKFFWNAAAVVGGLASGGLATPALLAAVKGIDSLVQGKEFSAAVGDALKQGGKTAAVMGAKALATGAAQAATSAAQGASDAINSVTGGTPGGTTGGTTTPPTTGAEGGAPATPSNTVPTSYTTVPGDQLGKIAQANQTTTQAIIDANGPELAAQLKAAANGKDLQPGVELLIPKGSAAAGTNPFAGNTHFKMNEAMAALGFTVTKLPMNEMVDKEATVRKWALNESLGRRRAKSVQLTEAGVNVILFNLGKLQEAALATPPAGALPGGPAPAGNTIPNLAADPTGQYATTATGPIGNSVMDKIEGGLNTAGNWLSNKFKTATTKFDANRAKRRLADAGLTDSNEVAKWLTSDQKVPADIVTAIYKQLGFPDPAVADGVNKNKIIQGLGGGADLDKFGERDAAATTDAAAATSGASSVSGTLAQDASATGASKQQQEAAQDVDKEIDDLLRSLRRVDNMHQPAYVKYIRDALDRTFGPAMSASAPAGAEAPVTGKAGVQGQVNTTPAPTLRTGTTNESRKRNKGRYLRESKSAKLTREFANFVNSAE